MNKSKIILTTFLLSSIFMFSGSFVTKAGNYVSEKSKAGWSATKSFFAGDNDK